MEIQFAANKLSSHHLNSGLLLRVKMAAMRNTDGEKG